MKRPSIGIASPGGDAQCHYSRKGLQNRRLLSRQSRLLSVKDNGRGFKKARATASNGFENMNYRARAIGAQFIGPPEQGRHGHELRAAAARGGP